MFKLTSLYAMLASALGAEITPRGRVNPFACPSQPPEAARYWHAGMADPVQAARIEAAAVKRARRADKLTKWAACTAWGQPFDLRDYAHTPMFGASFFTSDQCTK